jgi:hypothetical protein
MGFFDSIPTPTPPIPCPFCGKFLRTGLAKQCRFCKRDWHDGSEHSYSNAKSRSNDDKHRTTEQKPVIGTVSEACRILQLTGDVTLASVRTSYRKAIMQWHPDRLEGLAPELVKLATQRTVEINLAYELLLSTLK